MVFCFGGVVVDELFPPVPAIVPAAEAVAVEDVSDPVVPEPDCVAFSSVGLPKNIFLKKLIIVKD